MRVFRTVVLLATLALAGCASSHVLTGTPRAPIDPAQVRIYYGPPPGQYEEIAILNASSGALTYGDQNKIDSALQKLRREAAKLGANGVLFQGTADGHRDGGIRVGGGLGRGSGRWFSSAGVGVNVSPRPKYANGIAIWVPNPPPETAPQVTSPPQR
ncbi:MULTISPECIES: hypothetical protein [Luteimonas]|uniref:DUF4156 domain-containing protein n=1 Tax=Luteimonas chenhongjianii TaxID=2006110 RepID=A0A290XCR4_9GAMM|nr:MULTISPECIES: hypothetical protein [Luteimonas]ATD66726.1 hypothetical protein CNR27_04090 [Luteimonas chenhongjianii]RPD83860.1 hypothetical protein EGK76_14030 [Luteimonas sp. 100069]